MNITKLTLGALTLCVTTLAIAQDLREPHFGLSIDVTTDHAWRLTRFEGFPAGAVAIPELTGDLTALQRYDYMVNFYPVTAPEQAFHLTFTAETGKTCAYYVGFDKPGRPLMVVTGDGNCQYRVERNSLVLSLG